jgi:hypothetical protein
MPTLSTTHREKATNLLSALERAGVVKSFVAVDGDPSHVLVWPHGDTGVQTPLTWRDAWLWASGAVAGVAKADPASLAGPRTGCTNVFHDAADCRDARLPEERWCDACAGRTPERQTVTLVLELPRGAGGREQSAVAMWLHNEVPDEVEGVPLVSEAIWASGLGLFDRDFH